MATGGSATTDTSSTTDSTATSTSDTTTTTGSGGSTSTSTTSDTTTTGSGGSTSTTTSSTTTGSGGSTSTTTSSTTTGGASSCANTGLETYFASFDSDLEGFRKGGTAVVTHTLAMGFPELGAVDYTNTGGRGQVQRQSPDLDLSGRVISVYVYLDNPTAVDMELFAQTGNALVWASSGLVSIQPGQWTCLTLDVDNPPTVTNGYDTTDVRYFGVQIQRLSSGSHAYVDQFAY